MRVHTGKEALMFCGLIGTFLVSRESFVINGLQVTSLKVSGRNDDVENPGFIFDAQEHHVLGRSRTLTHDHASCNPDGRSVWFCGESFGWNHA